VFCTTREGGVSHAPYNSLNLGDHVGDAPQDVFHNRQALAEHLQQRPVFMHQVHGRVVAQLHHDTPDGQLADACFTLETGLACTIMVADCLPILFYSPSKKVVAAAHAGWRGLAGVPGQGGVLEEIQATLQVLGGLHGLRVWLGPCIGPSAFEVGEDVRQVFIAHDPLAGLAFQATEVSGKYLCDLPQLARQRLSHWPGVVTEGNDSTPSWCTFSNPAVFFSYRRDGVTGRFAAGIGLLD
jgi:hypothetical protein